MDEKRPLVAHEEPVPRPVRRAWPRALLFALVFCSSLQWLTLSAYLSPSSNDGIAWSACPDDATTSCGYLTVPMDYSDPDPKDVVSIALRKLPALVPRSQRRGSLLINPGGPGGSGHASVLRFGRDLSVILQGHYDIIGFDPRGVNLTTPTLGCYQFEGDDIRQHYDELLLGLPLEARRGAPKFDLHDPSQVAYLRRVAAHFRKRAEICQQHGDQRMLSASTTSLVARDMKSIMEAVGDKKLTYWGFSYGTILGATFAAMFPDLVERLVLDGTADAALYHGDDDIVTSALAPGSARWGSVGMADTNKTLHDGFLGVCAEVGSERCAFARANSTAAELSERLDSLVFGLNDEPMPVATSDVGGGVVTGSDVQHLVFGALYKPSTWPLAMQTLAELERGNGTRLLNSRGSVPITHHSYTHNPFRRHMDWRASSGVSTPAIMCADNAVRYPTLDLPFMVKFIEAIERESFTGGIWSFWLCAFWPYKPIERYDAGWDGLNKTHNPLLFVSNTADPVTPLVEARSMAQRFGNESASLLIQDGFGHCSLAQPSACTAKAIRRYFLDGVVPAYGTTCGSDAGFPYPAAKPGESLTLSVEDAELAAALQRLSIDGPGAF